MIAAYLPEARRVGVGEFDTPEPGADQLLVKMEHAAICGSDVHAIFDGFHVPTSLGRPGYPGHEGVGVVIEPGRSQLRAGTRVLTVPIGWEGACFAEFQAIDRAQVIPVADDADPRRVLMAQQLGTTIFALRKFLGPGGMPGPVAAIIGAGSAGLFFVQQLRRAGAETILISDRSPERLRLAAALGATQTIAVPGQSLKEAVRDLTDGRGADLVIEAVGLDATRAEAATCVRTKGTVGFFGLPERHGLVDFPFEEFFRKSVRLETVQAAQLEHGLPTFHDALGAILDGEIEVDYCLHSRFTLQDTPDALAVAHEAGHGAAKVTIDIAAS